MINTVIILVTKCIVATSLDAFNPVWALRFASSFKLDLVPESKLGELIEILAAVRRVKHINYTLAYML